jgi:tRNA pseudouridine13 synthase
VTDLPYLTADIAPIGGVLRTEPDDFRVEEIPAYGASGDGDHLYVTFEKRGLATPDAVRAIARALGVDPRDAGWAGLKDKNAVTVQTASFLKGDADKALALAIPNVRVLEARRHRNKLKSGHLHGNRFVLRVRGCVPDALTLAARVRDIVLVRGLPNYYGAQRFGREGDNAARGRAWLTGAERPPREPFLRKMYASAVQSELFNAYVAARLRDGLLDQYVDGDLAVRHPVGGPFLIDPAEAATAYAARTCSATGPMFGPGMRWPERAARAREEQLLAASGLTLEAFARAKDLGEGTRRAIRIVLDTLELRELPTDDGRVDLEFRFALPAGGYATSVLREFRKSDDEGLKPAGMSGIESPDSGPETSA